MIGNLAARVAIGALFVGHGTQKLFGWFDGPGFEGTQQMTKNLNLHPAKPNALAVGVSEAGGGALLALGLATPLAASTLIGTMITAIRKVHLTNGPWVTKGGYEYNLVLIAALRGHRRARPRPGLARPSAGHRKKRREVVPRRARPRCRSLHRRHRRRRQGSPGCRPNPHHHPP